MPPDAEMPLVSSPSPPTLPPSVAKVVEAAALLGLVIAPRLMPASTRTALEAAAACGCDVGQIVKSLVFAGAESRRTYLMLVSGTNRVDEAAMKTVVGEALARPNADAVRAATGFAIGGVPPFGHATPSPTFFDEDLLRFDLVWAAAGHSHAVFSVDPRALADAIGARVVKVT